MSHSINIIDTNSNCAIVEADGSKYMIWSGNGLERIAKIPQDKDYVRIEVNSGVPYLTLRGGTVYKLDHSGYLTSMSNRVYKLCILKCSGMVPSVYTVLEAMFCGKHPMSEPEEVWSRN